MIDPLTSRYPGRFIIIGKDGDSAVVLYGATGRSPSSLARKFTQHGSEIFMGGIDDTVSKEGNPELLEYPAVRIFQNGMVVANGRQIGHVTALLGGETQKQLDSLLITETYEPDEYCTPRITGCVGERDSGLFDASLHIARKGASEVDRSSWTLPLGENSGFFISTYEGDDVKPTPSFSGDPRTMTLNFGSAQVAAKTVFEHLTPPTGEMDYRVGIIALYKKFGQPVEVAIMNRVDVS